MLKALIHEYRTHGWARFTARLILFGVILWLAEHIAGWFSHAFWLSVTLGSLWLAVKIAAVVVVIYYLIRLIGFVRRRLLWRLTRRLVVTYVFIAFVPIILILLMVGLGAYILNGQFAAFLVNAKLRNHVDELKQVNRVVAHEAVHIQEQDPGDFFDALEKFYLSDFRDYANSYPGLEITLRIGAQARGFHLTGEPMRQPISEPRWLSGDEWSGFAIDREQIFLMAVDKQKTLPGTLTMILAMPITPPLLNIVGEGIGPVGVFVPEANRPRRVTLKRPVRASPGQPPKEVDVYGQQKLARYEVKSNGVPLPKRRMWIDFNVYGLSALNPVIWRAPAFQERSSPILVGVNSRVFQLNAQLLSMLGQLASIPVAGFIVVGVGFLSIEIVALAIGVLLTRSITSTVNRLQVATERVKSGDFSHRIGLPAHDQVSALGAAFDTMTASIQRLMVESREKVRLENELKIAHEVQQQLFPQANPDIHGARVFGECRAARGVSGDFYDFLKLGRGQVGLVLGDVSGKGIYAALLMAGIQSAVRAQFYDGHFPDRTAGALPISTATVLDRLNRQIYDNTPDAKYATFFYAIYEAETRSLAYTNAGHPAPFLFRRDRLMRLDAGGTVLGLFPTVQYQQERVQLEPGDVLLAFTDGLIEPENSYGEEFGDERLADAVRGAIDLPPELLANSVYREVVDWSGSAEQSDDMTLLYLKATR
ncbi:MAG: PP2C family protein-serine/threonine phosphatase [Terriglobia bacterium]